MTKTVYPSPPSPSGRQSSFFVTGGTLPEDAASYVTRRADDELYHALCHREFCYVLTSRQMGKSSLRNRASARLRDADIAVAELDLTGIGQNLSVEQWYDGLVYELGRELNCKRALAECWERHLALGPLHRLLAVLREAVLPRFTQPVVIFVDEIEVARGLPFCADEFFAAIRECYNRRSSDPTMGRLTFCLLGTATPSDLISDIHITPFNIGRRIELTDFTDSEAATLAIGLCEANPQQGERLLQRVLYWTDGHPYLTQRLCKAVADVPGRVTWEDVDRLCEHLFLSRQASEADANLAPVKHYLLYGHPDRASLLDMYARVLKKKRFPNDETAPLLNHLRLSGVVKVERGSLRVRNRIYERVFSPPWVQENLPDAEIRRQKKAFSRGILRATMVFGVLSLLFAMLTWMAVTQAWKAQKSERATRQIHYVADMHLVKEALDQYNLSYALKLLKEHRNDAMHGFEYGYFWQICNRSATTLRGHTSLIYGIAYSPDGRRVVTAGDDRTIKVWDTNTGRLLLSFHDAANICALAYSPDGRWLATAGIGGSLSLWDASNGRRIAGLPNTSPYVMSLAFSPDSRQLASAGFDQNVTFWNMTTQKAVKMLGVRQGRINMIAYSPDGKLIATASDSGRTQLWNSRTYGLVRSFQEHNNVAVSAVAFSPDGKWLADSSEDKTVVVWDRTDNYRSHRIIEKRVINTLGFSPKGNTLALGNDAGAILLYSLYTLQPYDTLLGHTRSVRSLAFSPDGRFIASGSWDYDARLWDVQQSAQEIVPLEAIPCTLKSAAISPDGNTIAGVSIEDHILLWNATTGRRIKLLPLTVPKGYCFNTVAFTADGKRLVITANTGFTYTVTIATGEAVRQNNYLPDQAIVSFSQDGQWIAIGGKEGTQLRRRDASATTPFLLPQSASIKAIAFSADNRFLATSDSNHFITLWNLQHQKPVDQKLYAHNSVVNSIAFSPDGSRLVTGSGDTTIRFWSLAVNRETLTLGTGGAVLAAAFTAGGHTLTGVTREGTIQKWYSSAPEDVSRPEGTRTRVTPSE